MKPRIVVLLPGISAHGGIQRHNRTFCKVLMAFAHQISADVEVLSLHDPDGWFDTKYLVSPIKGCGSNRMLFVRRSLAMLAKRYDLIVIGHVDFSPLVLLPHLLQPKSPLLFITHGIEVWSRLPLYKRIGLYAASKIIAVSQYTADQLILVQNINPNIIQVIPNTMDEDFLFGLSSWQQSGEYSLPTRLLTISRMNIADIDKGIDHVISALPKVRACVPDVNYTIVGNGDDRPRLEQLARDLGVDDIVHFVGRVPDQELYSYLSGADLFVLPSRKEGFGIVFLEAMAYAKPVIAGAHGGSPEVVVDGETGILVQHDDREALSYAIINLLQDDQKRKAMGAAGLERVQTVFNYEQFRSSIERTLDELLMIGA